MQPGLRSKKTTTKKPLALGVLVPAVGKRMGKGGRKPGRRDVYLMFWMSFKRYISGEASFLWKPYARGL